MKILIVDDDADYRKSLQEVLETSNHNVLAVDSADAAILAYQQNDGINLVITDYNMPKKNGLVVIRAIRAIQPKARLWLVSSGVDDEMKKAAIELGAEQSIWKADIRKQLQQWNIIN
jgi:CheY-like chemotaxis protein